MLRKIGLTLAGLMFSLAANAAIALGDTPPPALGSSSRGDDITVPALRGKVVVLSFWARPGAATA